MDVNITLPKKTEKKYEFIFNIITSVNCTACKIIKGKSNGNIFTDDKEDKRIVPIIDNLKWDKHFFEQVLGDDKTKVQEIVFKNTNASRKEIEEFIEYKLDENKNIKIYKYTRHKNPELCQLQILEESNIQNLTLSVAYETILNKNIPDYITNYVYYFPGFIISTIEEWSKAIIEKLSFFKAYPVGCYIIPHMGGWVISKNDKDINKMKPANPINKLNMLRDGHISLNEVPKNDIEHVYNIIPQYSKIVDMWTSHRQIDGERPFSSSLEYNVIPDDLYIYF